jgi:hypothetical protein
MPVFMIFINALLAPKLPKYLILRCKRYCKDTIFDLYDGDGETAIQRKADWAHMTNWKDSADTGLEMASKNRRREDLTPAARRALVEAAERRAQQAAEADAASAAPKEIDGVDGPEPVRYGDWENKGRASDF